MLFQEGKEGPVCAKQGHHEAVHQHPRGQVGPSKFHHSHQCMRCQTKNSNIRGTKLSDLLLSHLKI